jgi:hypothetical protein
VILRKESGVGYDALCTPDSGRVEKTLTFKEEDMQPKISISRKNGRTAHNYVIVSKASFDSMQSVVSSH